MTLKEAERSRHGTGWTPRHAARPSRRWLGAHVAALALIAVLVPLHRWWSAQLLLVPLLLTIPGVILLRALRISGQAVSSFPVYVPCASIVVLFGSGLAVDLIGPLLGVRAPIRTWPLLVGLVVICLALLAASVNAPSNVAIPWSSLSNPARLAWPMIIPLIAAAGALRLNSGHSDDLALIALFTSCVVVLACIISPFRLNKTLLAVVLYAVELAAMWSFSLRGHLVYGSDIATEYYDLHRTVLTGIWHTAHPGDAYGAMLSVTVMPAELHFLSGVPDLLVLKLVYPAIGALLPVAVFGLARRVLSLRWAFVAAAVIVMQVSFAQELPAIARQEIALVLFAALIMAMLDRRLQQRSQLALVVLLSLAMVQSHYSTTYVAMLIMGLTVILQWMVSWLRKIPHLTGAVAVAFIASCVGGVLWYGPVTYSANGPGQLIKIVNADGLDFLPNRTIGMDAIDSYLQGNTATPIPAEQYEQLIATEYASNDLFITPLPDANSRDYALQNSAPPIPAVKWSTGYRALSLGSLVVQQLLYLLGAIGALLMVLRRKASVVTRHVGLLALAALLFLVIIRLSGTLAVAYNQERALLQAMMVFAIAFSWSIRRLAGRRKRRQVWVLTAVAGSLTIMFIGTSGLLGAVLGGGTATNLANSGEDFERFYMTTPELASAVWLGQYVQPGQLVYADRYAQLPLIAMTGISHGLFNDVTPLTLNQHAWVYASRTNAVDGRARALYNQDHTVTYVFPAGFLDANYNLVYTNGSSEVFHR
jgi:uncharacterized membrane protein